MGLGRAGWTLLLGTVQVTALVGTFFVESLGSKGWHHIASLVVVLVTAAGLPGPMRSRRFLGIGVLVTTILASASGFYLLYWKEGIRVDGYQDWGVWWHVAWSWAAAVFFWQHTWVNRVAFGHFFMRTFNRVTPGVVHAGLYAVALAGLAVTAGPGKGWFTNENYIEVGVWIWLVVTSVAYAAWWGLRRKDHAVQRRLRGGVDLALVPMAAAATLSGIPLLWFGDALDGAGLKYASKVWHVAPSILFTVLVFVHGAQLWAALRTHWRRMAAGLDRAA